jgi:hypothetical protein
MKFFTLSSFIILATTTAFAGLPNGHREAYMANAGVVLRVLS